MPGLAAYWPVLLAAILIGALVLVAIARELGARSRLSPMGRIALAAGLGMGVLSVGAKAAIILALSHMDLGGLADTGRALREPIAAERAEPTPNKVSSPRRAFPARAWRALPPRPRGPAPADAMIDLGRSLFFETDLSRDRSISCASCHDLAQGGDDGRPVSLGVGGAAGSRNAPTVLNTGHLRRLFWDGRAGSLEEQAMGPLFNPVEMAMPSPQAIIERLQARPKYVVSFERAFGRSDALTVEGIVEAIAAFERSLPGGDSAYDRFIRGDETALSAQQLRGMAMFDALGCRDCHADPEFSSAGKSRALGGKRRFPLFPGDARVAKYELLMDGAPALWRAPSLRNVAKTAPYFHNGAVPTLEEAVRVMVVSQLNRRLVEGAPARMSVTAERLVNRRGESARLLSVRPSRDVTEAEIADIIAFLGALSDSPPPGVAP